MFSTQYLDALGGLLRFLFWWFAVTAVLSVIGVLIGLGFLIKWLVS